MRIRIVANPKNRIAAEAARAASAYLAGKVRLTGGFNCDLVLSFGGDGTLLHTFRELGRRSVPVLGVNCGEVGFLTDIDTGNFMTHIPAILKGRFAVESRARIECGKMLALNDIVIAPAKPATAVRYSLAIDGEKIWDDCGDGAIVATPTGSTAYAFSAGGPVVASNAMVLVIAPLNSVGKKAPLVIPDACSVEFSNVRAACGCEIVADGQSRLRCPASITIKKSRHPALLARLNTGYAGLYSKTQKKAGFDYGV